MLGRGRRAGKSKRIEGTLSFRVFDTPPKGQGPTDDPPEEQRKG